MKRVIVIGGGAAGMMAAGAAGSLGKSVVLLERNEKLGKKIYITGKGRCNVTNASDRENHIKNTVSNPYFMYSSIYGFGPEDVIELIEKMGVKTKTERGNRVFPMSDKSSDIIKALERYVKGNGVEIRLGCRALEFVTKDGRIKAVKTNRGSIDGDSFVIATGGVSYPSTGSTGDGYNFAKSCGHSVTGVYPSLVGLKGESFCGELAGLGLKNIGLTAKIDGKTVYEDFGELLFTHTGVSGPVILSASRYLTKNIKNDCRIYIDFKPALDEKTLDKRILRDFEKSKNKELANGLEGLLPKSVIPVIIKKSGVDGHGQVNSVSREERKRLLQTIKNFEIKIYATEGFNRAVITCGGVDTKEIDPGTMKSRIIENLYFAGEVMDLDAMTGGYNLQIAFSTGYCAGFNA